MHDSDKLNRERRGAETAKLDAARDMLAALIEARDALPDCPARITVGVAIAYALAAGIRVEGCHAP